MQAVQEAAIQHANREQLGSDDEYDEEDGPEIEELDSLHHDGHSQEGSVSTAAPTAGGAPVSSEGHARHGEAPSGQTTADAYRDLYYNTQRERRDLLSTLDVRNARIQELELRVTEVTSSYTISRRDADEWQRHFHQTRETCVAQSRMLATARMSQRDLEQQLDDCRRELRSCLFRLGSAEIETISRRFVVRVQTMPGIADATSCVICLTNFLVGLSLIHISEPTRPY